MRVQAKQSRHKTGFDSSVFSRDDDHLDRWAFAREIATVATTSPLEWSVRIGIYGEWGTGKTSVLKFIDSMVRSDDHITVWFDPWGYSSGADMWRSFVLEVYKEIEDKVGGITSAGAARRKDMLGKISRVVKSVGASAASVQSDALASTVDSGLEFVRDYLSVKKGDLDLEELRRVLGNRRVIILIDDLDRTAAELVPQILFALKELMDIPGFSFIAAFDPVVVGKVLHKSHRGFGDGLKFLDKIIDYPRWLPPASVDGLTKLAIAEAEARCPFVPTSTIRDAVTLLPPNPRAIRQFIRLLALLKPQIDRHYEHELRWPVIVTANVIKVRYPKIAYPLLGDKAFWESMEVILMTEKEDAPLVVKAITEHVEKVVVAESVTLEQGDRKGIIAAINILCAQVSVWQGNVVDQVFYQMHVAENPSAVTWKEYDKFRRAWDAKRNRTTLTSWIKRHAKASGRSESSVYRETFDATIGRLAEALRLADTTVLAGEAPAQIAKADKSLALLECLAFEEKNLPDKKTRLTSENLDRLFETFAALANSAGAVHAQFWPRCKALLLRVVAEWAGDLVHLMEQIQPYRRYLLRHFAEGAAGTLHGELCDALLPRTAETLLASLSEPAFVAALMTKTEGSCDFRMMLMDKSGPLWTTHRKSLLKLLGDAPSKRAIQENAYALLDWFQYSTTQGGVVSGADLRSLMAEREIAEAIWNAAVAHPLGERAVVQISIVPAHLKSLGSEVILPVWWSEAISRFQQRTQVPREEPPTESPESIDPPI